MIPVIAAGLVAAAVAFILTFATRKLARRLRLLDNPAIDPTRRLHTQPIPLTGGYAIGGAVLILLFVNVLFFGLIPGQFLNLSSLLAIGFAIVILLVGGYFDDRYRLPARWSVIAPVLAVLVVLVSGVGINFITNPFGGVWRIDSWKIELFSWQGIPFIFNLGADLFAFVWLMSMMYTTKLLDGLDGLVSGLTTIAAVILVALSLRPPVLQPDTAMLAAIVAGAFLGFLPFNWAPAKVFLGEGGSLLSGFLLGVLAILAGGKIATTLLVMGIPALDLLAVALRRVFIERRSFASADRLHLHFRLLDAGLSVRQAVLVFYACALVFGTIALTQQSKGKFFLLLVLAIVMVSILLISRRRSKLTAS